MGVIIPQVVTTDRASGAQVIDGSLKFDKDKLTYLSRTPGSSGDRNNWTISCWLKRDKLDNNQRFFESGNTAIRFGASNLFQWFDGPSGSNGENTPAAKIRDTSGWYHCVFAWDSSAGVLGNRIYLNGVELDYNQTGTGNPSSASSWNTGSQLHTIGQNAGNTSRYYGGRMSQVYFIDGQTLTPEYFGYTDGLTNTWRPKKYEGTFGTNGFYLPMDGNSPIGEDKSGLGNNWTPVNFGGSVALDNPQVSGARPILNTLPGGTQAGVGVFGSKENKYYTVTTANGSVYQFDITSGDNPSLSFIRGATYKFDYSSFTGHPVLFSSTNPDSSTTAYTDGTSIASNVISFTVPHNAPDTLYYYCQNHPTAMNGSISITTDTKKADPYAWKNVLGLPLVGSANDLSNQINSGSTTKTVAVTGATVSTTQSNFYGGSLYFNGPTDGASNATQYAIVSDSNSEFAFGTNDFTMEFWVWGTDWTGGSSNQDQVIFGHDGSDYAGFYIPAGVFSYYTSSASIPSSNKPTLLDNKWYHVAVSRESGTSRVFLDGVLVGSASDNTNHPTGSIILARNPSNNLNQFNGYIQDVRVYSGVAKYTDDFVVPATSPDILPDTPSGVSGGSKLTKITDGAVSFTSNGVAVSQSDYLDAGTSSDFTVGTSDDFSFEAYIYPTSVSDTSVFGIGASTMFGYRIISGSPYLYIQTTGGILNTGTIAANKWTHIAVTRSSGTLYSFINGVLAGSVANTSSFSASGGTGAGTFVGAANLVQQSPPRYGFTGHISNLRFIKGTALYTSNFTPPTAPLTNVTNTKLLCCQSPTSATAAAVTPGSITANGDAAATNFNPFNTDINTVRGQETGYATLNPLASASTLSNGNLTMTSGAAWGSCLSTISFTGGKYYWETYVVSSNYSYLGVSRSTHLSSQYPSQNKSWALLNDGNCYYDQLGGEAITVNTGTAVPAGATVGTAVDADSGKIWWSVNGVWIGSSGVPNNGNGIFSNIPTDESLVACVDVYSNTATMNFGQKPFKFPPPAGFQPLNAANVRPETVIVRPDQYVGVTTYTGTITDTSSQTVTGLNFESNLVWIKRRDGTNSHQLVDSVRGTGKWLESSGTAAENSTNTNGVVTDINSNGFTLTGGSTNANLCCEDGFDYVGWCWKAGGNSNTFNIDDVGYDTASAAGLTAGTKTPTGASVNTKSGFSIIAFTGDETAGTISHGLGKAPSFYIVKTRDSNSGGSNDWYCYHSALGASARIQLNSTAAQTTGSSQWNSTSPTSSVLSLGSGAWQETGDRFIIYAWAEIPGFSKFGSYTGNGSADGPVIITGFRPKLILIKRYDSGSTASWHLYDSERAQYNVITTTLAANEYSGESLFSSGYDLDFLSNGVKIRAATSNAINTASGTYIYAAWAEAPSVNLYGAQSNAR